MPPATAPRANAWEWLVLVRVDDRLLHGQVALNWVKALNPERIVIADDALARDPLGRAAIEAAAPPDVALRVGTIHQAAAMLENTASAPGRTIVLLRDPAGARALHDAGVAYPRLNLGALGWAPRRARIGPQVYVSREEWEALQSLVQAGVDVTIQALPSDAAVALSAVRPPRV